MDFFYFVLTNIEDAGTMYDQLIMLLGRDHEITRSMEMFLIEDVPFKAVPSDKPAQVCDSNSNDSNAKNIKCSFRSFEHFIKWALYVGIKSFPESFDHGYKNDLVICDKRFSLWFSENSSIMMSCFRESDICVCVTCRCDEKSPIYENALKHGWKMENPFSVMLAKEELRNAASGIAAG